MSKALQSCGHWMRRKNTRLRFGRKMTIELRSESGAFDPFEHWPVLEACSHQVRGSTAARYAFSSTSFHCFSLSGPHCLHQPYQTRLNRGIGSKCLNVGRLKKGGESSWLDTA